MIEARRARLLLALFLVITAALNFPVLTMVEAARDAIGAAWVPLYVFAIWGVAILGAALLLERRGG